MNAREIELHIQRGQLRERIRAQRVELGQNLAPVRVGLDKFDYAREQARHATHWLRRKPAVVTAAAVAFITWKPRFVFRMVFRTLRRGYGFWRTWKKVQRWTQAIRRA